MKFIKAFYEILTPINRENLLKRLELYGRTCYKSENKVTEDSASHFIKNILISGHESVIEHENITIRFVCDRGISHELVRHRLCSFSQESSRYCNYTQDKFGNELTFIIPNFWESDWDSKSYLLEGILKDVEEAYFYLIKNGAKPEQARYILPNGIKTEVIMTTNLREWRHILKVRTSYRAHPQMRELMIPLLKEFNEKLPEIFGDIYKKYCDDEMERYNEL